MVLVAREARALVGVMPVWVDAKRREAGFPDDFSDHLDIIAEDGDLHVISSLLDRAIAGTGSYDRLSLGHIKHDSNCIRATRVLGMDLDSRGVFVPGKSLAYAVVNLTSGYDNYRRTLTKNFRHSLNRGWNKAERSGLVVRELKIGDLNPKDLPESFLSLHLSRFGERSSIKLGFKAWRSWLHNLLPALFAEQRMRVFAMLNDDRILGMHLAMVGKTGLYGWSGGWVPEASNLSPGKLIYDHVIRQSCAEGLEEYDFGWWGQRYKDNWKPTLRTIGELQFSTCK